MDKTTYMKTIKTKIYLISFFCALACSHDIKPTKTDTVNRLARFKRHHNSLAYQVDATATVQEEPENDTSSEEDTPEETPATAPTPTPAAPASTQATTTTTTDTKTTSAPAAPSTATPPAQTGSAATPATTTTTTTATSTATPAAAHQPAPQATATTTTTVTPAPSPTASGDAPAQPSSEPSQPAVSTTTTTTQPATPTPQVTPPAQPAPSTPSASAAPTPSTTTAQPTPSAAPAPTVQSTPSQPTTTATTTQPTTTPSSAPATPPSASESAVTIDKSGAPVTQNGLPQAEPPKSERKPLVSDIDQPMDLSKEPVAPITGPSETHSSLRSDNEDEDYDDVTESKKPSQPERKESLQQAGPIQEVKEIGHTQEVVRTFDDPEQDVIEFQFEDADLQNLVKQVSDFFDVTFITDDMISPISQNGKAIKGNKISFRTEKPLSKKEAWNLFQTFLDVAGFSLVPLPEPSSFRIVKTEAARKSAIPTFIGVKSDTLPDSDQLIRYLYFVQNIPVKMLESIITELRSTASTCVFLTEINGFVLTDKAYNIKSLMNIINELDQVALPQEVSVLKLKRANAQDVKALYDSIAKVDDKNRPFQMKKESVASYFPENVRMIAEPRTNSLILLGSHAAIKKIENFITTHVDVEIGKPYSPLRIYELKYADASTIASIMTELTQFGKDTPVGRAGGVRDGDKYMRQMAFTPELATNRLIIRGDEEDYVKAREIIKILDEPQPQIALEVLVIAITVGDQKSLGTQLRSAQPGINGLVGDNVKYQTSGNFMSSVTGSSIVTTDTNPGVNRLLGNLITLAKGAFAGNTLVTLGGDKFGIWGIFNILQTVTDAEIVSNPFIVATNKQKAIVSIGETRRVVSGIVSGATGNINSFTDDTASLSVEITPQINSDGMIVLDLDINIDTFVNQVDLTSATKNTKNIKTTTIVADREVLALGGLVKNTINNSTNKVPLLGNIPIIGWLFKNRLKTQTKDNLLVLISSRIIKPDAAEHMTDFTKHRVQDYIADKNVINKSYEQMDPVQKFFFNEKKNSSETSIDNLLFARSKEILKESKEEEKQVTQTRKNRRKRRQRQRDNTPEPAKDPLYNEPVVPGMMESLEQMQVAQQQKKSDPSIKDIFDGYTKGTMG